MKRCIYCDYYLNDSDNICPSCGQSQIENNIQIDYREVQSHSKQVKTGLIAIVAIGLLVGMRIGGYILFGRSAKGESDDSNYSVSTSTNKFIFEIKDKYFLESDGKYTFVVRYRYENNSGEPKNFVWACKDQVFLDGVECDLDMNNFLLEDNGKVQRSDDILSGKSVLIDVMYEMPTFNPADNHDISIRLSKPLDSADVVLKEEYKTSGIRIEKE